MQRSRPQLLWASLGHSLPGTWAGCSCSHLGKADKCWAQLVGRGDKSKSSQPPLEVASCALLLQAMRELIYQCLLCTQTFNFTPVPCVTKHTFQYSSAAEDNETETCQGLSPVVFSAPNPRLYPMFPLTSPFWGQDHILSCLYWSFPGMKSFCVDAHAGEWLTFLQADWDPFSAQIFPVHRDVYV